MSNENTFLSRPSNLLPATITTAQGVNCGWRGEGSPPVPDASKVVSHVVTKRGGTVRVEREVLSPGLEAITSTATSRFERTETSELHFEHTWHERHEETVELAYDAGEWHVGSAVRG